MSNNLLFLDVHSGVVGQEHMDPLQVIEMFVPVFCCLKDSCEYQPNLLEEFTRCVPVCVAWQPHF